MVSKADAAGTTRSEMLQKLDGLLDDWANTSTMSSSAEKIAALFGGTLSSAPKLLFRVPGVTELGQPERERVGRSMRFCKKGRANPGPGSLKPSPQIAPCVLRFALLVVFRASSTAISGYLNV